MSKGSKRGMSLEGKTEKMLEIFHENASFYQLKDLEKLGPKKGVTSQSVKDVVQNLVDDDLVFKDKIGTAVYFWSLPSRAGNQLRLTHEKLKGEMESVDKRHDQLLQQLDLTKKDREDSSEREAALANLKELEMEHKSLQKELCAWEQNDPALLEAMKNSIQVAHDALNRWTENIFILQQWCSKTFPEAKEGLNQMYAEVGITEDFDVLS